METPEERIGATTEHSESSALAVSYSAGMQQILDLPTFTGETAEDSETIGDWLDQIEIVAAAFDWDKKTKLAHLTSCLRGPAVVLQSERSREEVLPPTTRGSTEKIYPCPRASSARSPVSRQEPELDGDRRRICTGVAEAVSSCLSQDVQGRR